MPTTGSNGVDIDTSKPTATFTPKGIGRPWTLSVALPGSIISNAKKKLDLRTQLAGSISRALAVFCVDEIVIFNDGDDNKEHTDTINNQQHFNNNNNKSGGVADGRLTAFSDPARFLAYILAFQETPPFMRSRLFPVHENLQMVGILPSLDVPSHLRASEWCEYREAITVQADEGDGEEGGGGGGGGGGVTWVDCGLPQQKRIEGIRIPPKTRVTVKLPPETTAEMTTSKNKKKRKNATQMENNSEDTVQAVAPSAPREEAGYYWGYTVRTCSSLSTVFTESPFDGGYDLSLGTSERGTAISETLATMPQAQREFRHLIIVFGGVAGLEMAATNDQELNKMGVGKGNVGELFDHWVNLCPGQGSRTIRTEEAVWMGLMAVRPLIERR